MLENTSEFDKKVYHNTSTPVLANTVFKIYCRFKIFQKSIYLWEIQKSRNDLRYISFKIVPLYNYTLLSATVSVLETFLEVTVKTFSALPSHS